MNIDVIWYFDKAKWVYPKWRDGLKAAMEIIGKKHNVRWHLGTEIAIPEDSDFILNWDNSTSEFIPQMLQSSARKGLVLTTDLGLNIDALRNYDVIFPEARVVTDKIKPHGIRCITAFGTDTEFFRPMPIGDKEYEAFYPATFSPWKRQNHFASTYGDKGLLLGTVQPDGFEILKNCIEGKANIMIGYFPVEFVRYQYNNARLVHITGWEGSGRTVLEALSCGVPVQVAHDNHKCQEYVIDWRGSDMTPREFAETYYSASKYAEKLLKGIENA